VRGSRRWQVGGLLSRWRRHSKAFVYCCVRVFRISAPLKEGSCSGQGRREWACVVTRSAIPASCNTVSSCCTYGACSRWKEGSLPRDAARWLYRFQELPGQVDHGSRSACHTPEPCRLRALVQDRQPTVGALVAFKVVCFAHGGMSCVRRIEAPCHSKILPSTMLPVVDTHEDLLHAVTMPYTPCRACIHVPLPYPPLLPPPKQRVSELHTQRKQTCTQARKTTKEHSSPTPPQAKTIDEKSLNVCLFIGEGNHPTAMGKAGEWRREEAREGGSRRC
jgi:hypothetical protein